MMFQGKYDFLLVLIVSSFYKILYCICACGVLCSGAEELFWSLFLIKQVLRCKQEQI